MIDINILRNNPEVVKENIKRKFQDHKLPLVDEVIELDKQNRELKKKASAVEESKNLGIVAVAPGDGIAAIFKDLSVDEIITGGQTMNPSAADIAAAADKVPARTVFVYPNNKNIILAAEQANELTNKNLVVISTRSIPEGISAAIA